MARLKGGQGRADPLCSRLDVESSARARPEFKSGLRARLIAAPPVPPVHPLRRLATSPVTLTALFLSATAVLGGLLWSEVGQSKPEPAPPAPTAAMVVAPPTEAAAPRAPSLAPTSSSVPSAPTSAPTAAEPPAQVAPLGPTFTREPPSPSAPPATEVVAEPAPEERPARQATSTAEPAATTTAEPPATPTSQPDNPRPTFPAGPETPTGATPSPTP